MTMSVLPAVHALTSGDEHELDREALFVRVRRQVAVARTLLDEIERLAHSSPRARALLAQTIEELASIGCQVLEVTATLADTEEATR